MSAERLTFDTPQEVAHATADLFVQCAADAIAKRGTFSVSLAGGNTPKAAYALLGQSPRKERIDWSRVHVYFGDERCVPPGDEQSNYRMARETFLAAAGVPEQNVFRIQGELAPEQAARAYAGVLRARLGDPPVFDLVLLGMGPDGHTASLFPGTDPMTDDDQLVRAVYAPSVDMWRITLTPKVLNAGRTVAFGIEGSAKADAFAAVCNHAATPTTYPSEIIAPTNGRLIYITDVAASAKL